MSNDKIRNYVNALFTDVPRTKKAQELKEEMIADLTDRMNDYISQGQSENQAYSQTIANMGDVDELLRAVLPDENFRQESAQYRSRNARNIGIAIAMYILGAALLIGSALFDSDQAGIVGVVLLLVMVAAATGLIIYTNMSTPVEYRDSDDRRKQEMLRTPGGRMLRSILSIYWTVVTALYLLVSFLTMAWHMTWIIWPIAGVVSSIIQTIWGLKNSNEE